jgi:hypothetical protein
MTDETPRRAIIVDVTSGTSSVSDPLPGAIHGFDDAGGLLLVQPFPAGQSPEGFRLFRLDVVSQTISPVTPEQARRAVPPVVGTWGVAPSTGLWVGERAEVDEGGDQLGRELVVGNLRTGAVRVIAKSQIQFGFISFLPSGDRVIAVRTEPEQADGSRLFKLELIALDDAAVEAWTGTLAPISLIISDQGGFAGFDAWDRGPVLTLIDLRALHSARIQLPAGAQAASLIRITGG